MKCEAASIFPEKLAIEDGGPSKKSSTTKNRAFPGGWHGQLPRYDVFLWPAV